MSMLKALFAGLCVVVVASQIEGCADKRRDCIIWKYMGRCNGSLKAVMEIVCKKTCGHCDAPCVDKNTNCKIYKKLNYCGNQKFKPWLQLYCGLSCGFCTAAPTAAPQPPPLPEGMGKF